MGDGEGVLPQTTSMEEAIIFIAASPIYPLAGCDDDHSCNPALPSTRKHP
jgi:hypothetical protein